MFLSNFLDEEKIDLLYSTYSEEYIYSFNEHNFLEIYKLLLEYNFYYIDDIILNYLELFGLDKETVREKIEMLKRALGDNFVYIIGNDMRYLGEIIS